MTRNKSLTEMIEEGMSLREMSSELNHQLSHEAIRQYIMDSGNHKEWLNKREETEKTKKSKKKLKDIRRKLKETLTNKLSNSIYQVFKNKSLEKGWSYQKAIEYREKWHLNKQVSNLKI